MTDSQAPDPADQDPTDGWPDDPVQRRKAIEGELRRVRQQRSLAELRAKEQQLESLLRQLDETDGGATAVADPPRFTDWNDVAAAQAVSMGGPIGQAVIEPTAGSALLDQPQVRRDSPHDEIRRPHFDRSGDADSAVDPTETPDSAADGDGPDQVTARTASSDVVGPDAEAPDFSRLDATALSIEQTLDAAEHDLALANDSDQDGDGPDLVDAEESEEDEAGRRVRPMPWLISGGVHLVLLLILGWMTLQATRPKDQIAMTGSPSDPNPEPTIETLSIETNEPEVQPEDPSTTDVQYELSPVGEVYAASFSPDPSDAPVAVTPAARSLSQSSGTAMSLAGGDSMEKIEFCGIKGGGNHFVYLVDSSGSMGDAFASARLELLRSIAALRADQRFYVVFFDAESDYMRLSDANRDEPRSVLATPENKEKLRQWAMRIKIDKGRAPYDALRFALGLKPDVIFLLSDGEFPQGIVELLDEENRVENLFGDANPISIVHTISYHNREGETRMRLIAKKNQGQFRYVPDPSEKR
ncbi:vWA domain-containing protein [Crateriforma conspicua]|uniref:vWA domain-containing protein n=1 Tax=Crateriforma conspicua TaxID=2527996 RepID=UPI00118956F0|nr:hypothetical protein [Crateriforma conspicua]QDV63454.1 hypothetical protein Mal65_25970 [Crateriforma conspicua]